MCTEIFCPLCNVSTFPTLDSFKLNLIKVNSKPIKCPLCSEILLGLDKLTIHLFAHSYADENVIKSSTPDEHPKPPSTPPKINKKTTTTKPKQRSIKLMKMTSSPLVQQSSSSSDNFRCEICGFVFADEQLLNLHLNLVHNITPNVNSQQPSSPSRSVEDESTKWNCHLCGKHFKMKGALRIHIRVAHVRFHDQNQRQINIADYLKNQNETKSLDLCTIKTEMLSLQDPYSPENTQQHYYAASSPSSKSPTHSTAIIVASQQEQVMKNSKSYQCEECKKTFTTKYFLKKHKRLHTGEMPYKCHVEGCEKQFHFQQSYHKHLLYHSDAKPYECTECGRSFKELSTLHNHQRIHSGIKPFGCHVCGKFFRQKVSYLVHQRIHNGLLPYKCSECGKGFRYKVSQRSHKCSGALLERQPGDLIQKLMQNSSILPSSPSSTATSNEQNLTTTPSTTNDLNISNSNQKENEELQHETITAGTHDLCLDDLLKESFEKLMKVQLSPSHLLAGNGFENNTATAFDGDCNSMAINSDYGDLTIATPTNFHATLETINEDSIKELLYGHVG